jgi:hypothetical protein
MWGKSKDTTTDGECLDHRDTSVRQKLGCIDATEIDDGNSEKPKKNKVLAENEEEKCMAKKRGGEQCLKKKKKDR